MAALPYAVQFCWELSQRRYADETIFLPARLAAEQVGHPVPVLTAWGDERHTWPWGHRHQAARRLPGITSRGVRVPL